MGETDGRNDTESERNAERSEVEECRLRMGGKKKVRQKNMVSCVIINLISHSFLTFIYPDAQEYPLK